LLSYEVARNLIEITKNHKTTQLRGFFILDMLERVVSPQSVKSPCHAGRSAFFATGNRQPLQIILMLLIDTAE
jgi:hypothetical protein